MHRYVLLTLVICGALSALAPRLPPPPPPPLDDEPAPTPAANLHPSATITFADATQIIFRSTTKRFRVVGLHPNETVDIALQFSTPLVRNSASAQPLDGGRIISFSINSGGGNGLASIRFQVGSQPGLYRIRVPGLAESPLLQFWVADPNNPKANLPVVNPGH
jgi:hypothetical protein